MKPKWEEAFLSFQRLVTNSKLKGKKFNRRNSEPSDSCCGISASQVSVVCAEWFHRVDLFWTQTHLTLWQAERVAKVQSAIHVRVREGDKVLVFAGRKTKRKDHAKYTCETNKYQKNRACKLGNNIRYTLVLKACCLHHILVLRASPTPAWHVSPSTATTEKIT